MGYCLCINAPLNNKKITTINLGDVAYKLYNSGETVDEFGQVKYPTLFASTANKLWKEDHLRYKRAVETDDRSRYVHDNRGRYIPDQRGAYIHDTRGAYIHDNRFEIYYISYLVKRVV